eukprot:CAMPEP_0168803248 /NCGR_PEP_ID=MMETSP0725-20121227/20499_1 /TAXON_ID=265536 /ORGANISM="Amphiprora sp., Strain CCMP467" /LENGTH=46 /DNA_ID= /DNA_START= /DNA_END= /DNA_ORIENTATION=
MGFNRDKIAGMVTGGRIAEISMGEEYSQALKEEKRVTKRTTKLERM